MRMKRNPIIFGVHSLDFRIDFSVDVIHLPIDEFDYLSTSLIHVVIELLLVVSNRLVDTKNEQFVEVK